MHDQTALSRIHRSWLAASEARLLAWIAVRLPDFVTPDRLTALGLAGALTCGLAFAAVPLSPRFLPLAALGLLINWFGDSLDGNVARCRKIERPRYGFFIDHSTDVISQTFIFLGLGASHHMRFDAALLMLLSYWLAALYTFIRAVATRVFQISYGGVGPTEIRLALLIYGLVLFAAGPLSVATPLGPLSPLDAAGALIFAAVFISFLSMVWAEGRRLAALEPRPASAAGAAKAPGAGLAWAGALKADRSATL